MIVRIHSSGKSFSGTAAYLTHDPSAQTDERVAWTHTLNLANDHLPSAVDEMLWTARNAEILKQEAGIRAGGRATEYPVKHLSLNWAPEENPTREHMIGTTEEFLRHMKWHEHQAVLVAHDDKSYSHVHVMLNVVHPETGLRLDDNFERRRAQAWALEYEREHGKVYCEQRLKTPEEREDAPPRNMWVAFQENEKEFGRAENSLRQEEPILVENPENQKNAEWQILKGIQRGERTAFFADGKSEFSQLRLSIYREVREEFRERWADYYAARKSGGDPDVLAAHKAGLIADRKAVFAARRDAACSELRESRDERYRELLAGQAEIRADLRTRQEAGLDNAPFLEEAKSRYADQDVSASFHEVAEQVTRSDGGKDREADASASTGWTKLFGAEDLGDRFAGSMGSSVVSFVDSLFCDLLGERPPPPPRREPGQSDPFEASAIEAQKQQQEREREEAESVSRKHRPYGE